MSFLVRALLIQLISTADVPQGLMDMTRGEVSPGPGFQIALRVYSSLKPATTDLYTPTVTSPPSTCSSIVTISHSAVSETTQKGYEIRLATNLPPSPDSRICRCMMDSLDCIANHIYKPPSESLSPEIFTPATIFEDEKYLVDSVCVTNASLCLGSRGDTINGSFGAFSACNSTERGSWILNRLYQSNNNNAAVCNSAGGVLRVTKSAQPLSNACKNVMKQAGALGTGSITPSLAFDSENGSREMSQATKAAIVVGSLVFVAFLCAGILLGLRARRKKRIKHVTSPATASEGPSQAAKGDEFSKAELPDTFVKKIPFGAEIDGEEVNEMDGGTNVQEVGVGGVMAELSGSNVSPVKLDGKEDIFELPANEFKPVELDADPKKYDKKRYCRLRR
jgi:hypothetical protein